jgi:PadR family transcriptional regulator PadR
MLGMKPDKLKGHLDLLLMEILVGGPAHGYAVITALRDRSEGVFDLPEGTVYPALHRLEDAGLLTSDWIEVSGRRRRMYRLTERGQVAVGAERRQWRSFVTGIDAVLQGVVPAPVQP